MSERIPLVITAGEPAGIGAELVARSLRPDSPMSNDCSTAKLIVADAGLIQRAASQLGYNKPEIESNFRVYESFSDYQQADIPNSQAAILHIPMQVKETPGELNVQNSQYVLATIDEASKHCLSGAAVGLVTGPIHKGIINNSLEGANRLFSGHTEYLAALAGINKVVMMLATESFRVALVTTHLALKDVATAITRPALEETLAILQRELQNTFDIPSPQIIVCGLNPHAGEGGYLGMEEIEIISPVLEECRQQGMHLLGPLPADTAFTQENIAACDAVLAMYHDQGLPVLKYAGFGKAINITLGLPFIRTSVDHGTALDIAGCGQANSSSMQLAITTASQLVSTRKGTAQ